MHDGGDNMELKINGKTACVAKAVYGASNALPMPMKRDEPGTHNAIIAMEPCITKIQLKAGDKLSVTANYDIEKHPM